MILDLCLPILKDQALSWRKMEDDVPADVKQVD